jgi:parallel beta-helix repeat protein
VRPRFARGPVAAVLALGLGAGAGPWLEPVRPDLAGERAAGEVLTLDVTSGADAGPGSLREALFAAAASDAPALVVVHARVELTTPLPPLAAVGGLTVEGRAFARIDARRLAGAPALDVRGVFEANEVGVELPADARRTRLEDNRFARHRKAAVWAVAAAPAAGGGDGLELRRNRFAGDEMAIVLADVAATVEDNDFAAARTAAIYLSGAGAVVRGNRVRDGKGLGIHAVDARGAVIAGNELTGNGAVAVMVRASRDTRVEDNRLRANAYGIATLFGAGDVVVAGNVLEDHRYDAVTVIGGAPWLRANRVTGSRGAGLRLLDYLPVAGPRIAAAPRLDGNVFTGNRLGERLAGEYRERR